jgi:tRNA(Glu) U13 pseudouridine synthase TruD
LPPTLPLALSDRQEDQRLYQKYFKRDQLPQPLWKYLRAFPKARAAHREIAVKSSVEIQDIDVREEGIRLVFTLGKGQYATTFLSHMFNLVTGVDATRDNRFRYVDVSTANTETVAYFKEILQTSGTPGEEV